MATWEDYNKKKTKPTSGWDAYNVKKSEEAYKQEAKQYNIDPKVYTNLRQAGNNAFTIKQNLAYEPVSYLKNLGSGILQSTKDLFAGFFPVIRSTSQAVATPIAGLFASVPGGVTPQDAMKESWNIAKKVGSMKEDPEKAMYDAGTQWMQKRGIGKYGGNEPDAIDYAVLSGLGFANIFGDPLLEFALGFKAIKTAKEILKYKKVGSATKPLKE
ncbi:MAG: hypothetical protein U9M89_03145, partial [Patescibacteria group bacterium]|nr:hypothetical protein [Patescibacteria group bacterium]